MVGGNHVLIDSNKSLFQFTGYPVVGYNDMLMHEYNNPGVRIFNFVLDESKVNYHTLEGAGFLFNTNYVNKGNGGGESTVLKGYCILVSSAKVTLYRIDNPNNKTVGEIHVGGNISDIGTAVASVVKNKDKVHNFSISASATNVNVYDNGRLIMSETLTGQHSGESFGLYASYLQHNCTIKTVINFSDFTVQTIDLRVPLVKIAKIEENGKEETMYLPGAEFNILNSSKEVVASGTTDNRGTWNVEGVTAGSYTIVETKAPVGCVKSSDSFNLIINSEGKPVDIWGDETSIEIENELIKFELTKLEKGTNKPVAGATYALYESDGGKIGNTIVKDIYNNNCEKTSDENGKMKFIGVPAGTYYLKETYAPDGYAKDEKEYKCIVYEDGKIVLNGITNNTLYDDKLIKVEPELITITKYEENTTNPIKGAKIAIYKENGSPLLDDINEPVQLETGDSGVVDLSSVLSQISAGNYKYKEIQAPLGYELDKNTYDFTVGTDGKVTFKNKKSNGSITNDSKGIFYNKIAKIDVKVTKVWDDKDDAEEQRPDSIVLKVMLNDEEVERATVSSADNWTHTFNLPMLDSNKNKAEYKVDEEEVNKDDLKYYVKSIDNYTITNTFQLPEKSDYVVEHYKKNASGEYVLEEKETLQAETLSFVNANAKNYDGYITNLKANGTVQKGKVLADGSLVLKLYYDPITETTFKLSIMNKDSETSEPIEGTRYSITVEYEDGTNEIYNNRITDVIGNILIPNIKAKNITKIKIAQREISSKYKIDTEEKYASFRVVGENLIEATGSQSKDIMVRAKGNTFAIIQLNERIRPRNVLKISSVDGKDTDLKIPNVGLELTYPDGNTEEFTTNDQGEYEIKDLVCPEKGKTFKYQIKQISEVDGYVKSKKNVLVSIEFDLSGAIKTASIVSGDATIKHVTQQEETVINEIVEVGFKLERDGNGLFGDYKIKIVEKDKDTGVTVSGVVEKIIQNSSDNKITGVKTSNENGEVLLDALDSNEVKINVRRQSVPNSYVLVPDVITFSLVKNENGEYQLKEEMENVVVDAEKKLITINREVYKKDSDYDVAKKRLNTTIYITKVDTELRLLKDVDLVLREETTGNSWALHTDENGIAKLETKAIAESIATLYPTMMVESEMDLSFWITESSVPEGLEDLDIDIGFDMSFLFNPDGELEITKLNVKDGLSYDHIIDLEYEQELMDTYTQVNVNMKVINRYGKGSKYKLNIEKVDEEDPNIKLENASFVVTVKFPKTGQVKTTEITGEDGMISIPELHFPTGVSVITITEKTAPKDYALDKSATRINVESKDGKIKVSGAEFNEQEKTISKTITNTKKPEPYSVIIRKRDSKTSELIAETAVFNVLAKDDNNEKNYNVSTLNGVAKIEELNGKGDITLSIIETKAPLGYKKKTEPINIYLKKEAISKPVEIDTSKEQANVQLQDNVIYIDIDNEEKPEIPILEIFKVDSENQQLGLAGATFLLEGPNADQNLATTSVRGSIKIKMKDAVSGRYTLTEIKAPEHYVVRNKVALDIEFDENKNIKSCTLVTTEGEDFATEVVKLENTDKKINITLDNEIEIKPYTLNIHKIDKNTKVLLNDVTFDISIDGESSYLMTKTTGGNKGISINKLAGTGEITIKLQEKQSPKGYKGDLKAKEFKIIKDPVTSEIKLDTKSLVNIKTTDIKIVEQQITVTVENEKELAKLIIENQDLDDSNIKIPGTVFTVDGENQVSEKKPTDENGITEKMINSESGKTIDYVIKNTKMSDSKYIKNDDVTLRISYTDQGKIDSAEIISGDKNEKGKLVAEIDESVNYKGESEIKIIIRCEKQKEIEIELENQDLKEPNTKIKGTTFKLSNNQSDLAEVITNSSGSASAKVTVPRGESVEYVIKNVNMADKNYLKNDDVVVKITYTEDGKIDSAEVVLGEKDTRGNIVAEIDNSVPYQGQEKIKIIIKCEKKEKIKLTIQNEDLEDHDKKIFGTEFNITAPEIAVENKKTDSSGIAIFDIVSNRGNTVNYVIKNVSMAQKEYVKNDSVVLSITYSDDWTIESAKIVSGDKNNKGKIVAEIDESVDYQGQLEIKIIIRCDKEGEIELLIENVDISDPNIKIDGTTFEIVKDAEIKGTCVTDGAGTAKAKVDAKKESIIDYKIINKKITKEGYRPNEDITLKITYAENATIDSAEIVSKTTDYKGRIYAEIDESVNYKGEKEIKIIIKCEKREPNYIVIQAEDINDNSVKIGNAMFRATRESKLTGMNTTNEIGLTPEISLKEPEENEEIYFIGNLRAPKTYKTAEQVKLRVVYDDNWKIKEVSILSDLVNQEGKVKVKLDEEVDYTGKNQFKLIVRLEPADDKEEEEKELGLKLQKSNSKNEKIKVENAEYRIYVYNEDTGTEVTKTDFTNDAGIIKFNRCFTEAGVYTVRIKELESPEGYRLDEYVHTFKIRVDEKTKDMQVMEKDCGENIIHKVDNVNGVLCVDVTDISEGIDFVIAKRDYKDRKVCIKNAKYKIYNENTNEEIVTKENGYGTVKLPLKEDGEYTYRIKEIEAPKGYELNLDEFKVIINYKDGEIIGASVKEAGEYAYIENNMKQDYLEIVVLNKKSDNMIPYDIVLKKVDFYYSSIVLPGAEIKLDINATEGMSGISKTGITDEKGEIVIEDITSAGDVVIDITEITPPLGRKFDSKIKLSVLVVNKENGWIKVGSGNKNTEVDVDNENRVVTIQIRNYPDGSFVLTGKKVDQDDKNLELKGAKYRLEADWLEEAMILEENDKGEMVIPNVMLPEMEEGMQEFEFTLTETESPSGYALDETPIRIKIKVLNQNKEKTLVEALIVDGNAEVESVENTKLDLILKDKKIKNGIKITKVDDELNDYFIPNTLIKIDIYAESGEEYHLEEYTNQDGQIIIPNIDGTGKIEVNLQEVTPSENYVADNEIKKITFMKNPKGILEMQDVIGERVSAEIVDSDVEILFENILDQEKAMYLTVTKEWKDNGKETRPNEIKIVVKRDGKIVAEKVISNEETEAKFTDLSRRDEDGNEIVYVIGEEEVNSGDLKDYTAIIEQEDRKIINIHKDLQDFGKIIIQKVDNELKDYAIPNTLIRVDVYAENGQEYHLTEYTNEDGQIIIPTVGCYGKIEVNLQEIAPSENYNADNEIKKITFIKGIDEKVEIVDVKGEQISADIVNSNVEILFENILDQEKAMYLTVTKEWKDNGKETRPDAIKIVVKCNGEIVAVKVISNEETEAKFTDLSRYDENGNEIVYEIGEEEINSGDLKDYKAVIDQENRKITNIHRDLIPYGIITITKADSITKEVLQGAVIAIYNSNKQQLAELTTNAEGKIVFRAEEGTYYYKEIKAPNGYKIDSTLYEFKVDLEGKVTFITNNGIIYNEKDDTYNNNNDDSNNGNGNGNGSSSNNGQNGSNSNIIYYPNNGDNNGNSNNGNGNANNNSLNGNKAQNNNGKGSNIPYAGAKNIIVCLILAIGCVVFFWGKIKNISKKIIQIK